jgi:hypothetical protein
MKKVAKSTSASLLGVLWPKYEFIVKISNTRTVHNFWDYDNAVVSGGGGRV